MAASPLPMRANGEFVKFPDVIPFLAPGQEWQTMWDLSGERLKSDLPDKHDVKISYKGLDDKQLETEAILDWGIYKSKIYMVTYGLHDLAKAVREMGKNQKKWTDGLSGLGVFTRDGHAKDARTLAKSEDFRRRHRASQESAKLQKLTTKEEN